MARWVFKEKKTGIIPEDLKESTVQPLINETNKVLQDAVRRGIEHTVPVEMKRYLRENVHVFSGLKTYHELKEVGALLMDGETVKPFNRFWQDVRKVHGNYNQNYLQAEYIFATQSAQMASKWTEFEQDGDRYNLQYRTAYDDRVRESHAALHNTTLPLSDPFWSNYFPPNGWRCRCTTVQVRKSKYPESNSTEARLAGAEATAGKNNLFRFNPGKEKRIFPDKHPYFPKGGCAGCSDQNLSFKMPDNEMCRACGILKELRRTSAYETRKWAKENIQGQSIIHPQLKSEINISGGGIKEFTNQPHKYFFEKNKLLKNIFSVVEKSEYKGVTHYKGKKSHIFEIEIKGDKSWIIANEEKGRGLNLYSISDSNKVLSDIEKPI